MSQEKGNVTPVPIVLASGVFSAYGNGWRQMWKSAIRLVSSCPGLTLKT